MLSFIDWCVSRFEGICKYWMCKCDFNITDGRSLAVVRSNCRGWRWSSARWPGIKRSSSGTSWNWRSTHTCWESHARSCTAAPGWASIHQHYCDRFSDLNYCHCESIVSTAKLRYSESHMTFVMFMMEKHTSLIYCDQISLDQILSLSYLPQLAFFNVKM